MHEVDGHKLDCSWQNDKAALANLCKPYENVLAVEKQVL